MVCLGSAEADHYCFIGRSVVAIPHAILQTTDNGNPRPKTRTRESLHVESIRFLRGVFITKVFHNFSDFSSTSYGYGILIIELCIIPIHFC